MVEFLVAHLPWFWLSLLVIFVVVEAFTMALTTVWAALAAIPMIFISRTALPFRWQLLIFVVLTIVLIVFTRPFAVKKLKLGQDKMNVSSMLGQEVLVVSAIESFKKGEAKAKNGTVWTVTAEGSEEIAKDTVCVVTDVQGNTLTIKPKETEKTE